MGTFNLSFRAILAANLCILWSLIIETYTSHTHTKRQVRLTRSISGAEWKQQTHRLTAYEIYYENFPNVCTSPYTVEPFWPSICCSGWKRQGKSVQFHGRSVKLFIVLTRKRPWCRLVSQCRISKTTLLLATYFKLVWSTVSDLSNPANRWQSYVSNWTERAIIVSFVYFACRSSHFGFQMIVQIVPGLSKLTVHRLLDVTLLEVVWVGGVEWLRIDTTFARTIA